MNKDTSKCKFRFHRSTLEESMKTIIEVDSKENLCEIINKELILNKQINIDDIEIKYYNYDRRIEWKTYIVKLNDFGVVGFLNKKLI